MLRLAHHFSSIFTEDFVEGRVNAVSDWSKVYLAASKQKFQWNYISCTCTLWDWFAGFSFAWSRPISKYFWFVIWFCFPFSLRDICNCQVAFCTDLKCFFNKALAGKGSFLVWVLCDCRTSAYLIAIVIMNKMIDILYFCLLQERIRLLMSVWRQPSYWLTWLWPSNTYISLFLARLIVECLDGL